jgi:hypothetical protein
MSIRIRRGRAGGPSRVQTRSRSRFAFFLRHGDDALQIADGHVILHTFATYIPS